MKITQFLWLLLVAVTPVIAQQDNSATSTGSVEGWGSSKSPTAALLQPDVALGSISASETFKSAEYGTGGVALRNRGLGVLSVSGVAGPIKAAYVYWAVITNGAVPKADEEIELQRTSPGSSAAVRVTGKALGTGVSPCWGGTGITVYKGAVPTNVATGNGSYKVTLSAGASGSTGGQDPWISYVFPLFEGVSLVIIGSGTTTVALYDEGFAAHTFAGNPGLTYSLKLPLAAPGKKTLLDNIGADGQTGVSRLADVGLADEATTINSKPIAGPGSIYNDSDWNGSSGSPLPQLWDDTGHDITVATPKGTKLLNVDIRESHDTYDCMTTVANVVSLE